VRTTISRLRRCLRRHLFLRRALREVERLALTCEQQFPSTPYFAGRCNVCGAPTLFFCGNPQNIRESLDCAQCRCTSRYRALARGLLEVIAERTGVRASSLSDLARRRSPRRLAVYDTQVALQADRGAYPLPEMLGRVPWIELHVSVYKPSLDWGTLVAPGCSNQNLEALTFADAVFDIVLSSDVMEHVRLPRAAHREIRRVMRPGGYYLFTVPHDRSRATTLERVRVVDPEDATKDELLLPPEYHGDANSPDNRALAYRLYGRDLDDELQGLGFTVDYRREDDPSLGIVASELFCCRLAGGG
jgi:SAM-dependent methyltransferase